MAQGFTFPGPAHYISPIFGVYTPATDMTAGIMTYQGTICEQFELNFYRCTEAFGLVASKRKCDLEYRDFLECVYQRKQMGRYHTMRKERFKQFMEGKLDRPYTKNPPAIYEAWTDYYHHNPYAGPKMYN